MVPLLMRLIAKQALYNKNRSFKSALFETHKELDYNKAA